MVDDGIVCSPFQKDPGLSRRLAKSSAHPFSVHASWPRAMIKNLKLLTNSEDVAQMHIQEFQRRLYRDDCVVPCNESLAHRHAVLHARVGKKSGSVLWLPFSYHPWWYRSTKKALARWNADGDNFSLLKDLSEQFIVSHVSDTADSFHCVQH